jgi:hypothetical protein
VCTQKNPKGLREASLAVPIKVNGEFHASVAMRFMLVADGGKAGHALRLRLLRGLANDISSAAAHNA